MPSVCEILSKGHWLLEQNKNKRHHTKTTANIRAQFGYVHQCPEAWNRSYETRGLGQKANLGRE